MAQRPASTMPGWMKLLFLIFIGYVLYVGNFTSGSPPVATPIAVATPTAAGPVIPVPQEAQSGVENYSELRNFLDADRWRRALNPEYVGPAQIKELERGSGSAAGCGSEVTVRYRGTLSNGANFDTTHDERDAQTFRLGDAPIAAMNEGIIGMQLGGVRQLEASPKQVFNRPAANLDSVLFRIEMDALGPVSDPDMLPFALMQVVAARDERTAVQRCAEPVRADLVWFDGAGKVQKRETRQWRAGDRSIAVGLDRAVHGMRLGESRFVVLPPAWHKGAGVISALVTLREPAPSTGDTK